MEPKAIIVYVEYQLSHGRPDLFVAESGFHVSFSHPFLGATPDGSIYDPHYRSEPFRFLEVKCPSFSNDVEPRQACIRPDFFVCYQSGYSCYRTERRSHVLLPSTRTNGGREAQVV